MRHIVYAVMALGAASIAHSAPLTPAQQAFADAQALAASAQANAVSNLSSGGISSTVNQFNPTYYNSNGTAPESTLFQGGNGNTVSAGQSKVADCQNGTPNPDPFLRQNCEAINLMVNNPSNRPQLSPPASMFAASRAIEAQGITDPNATGSFTSCVNRTVGSLPTTELCQEWFGTSNQQCTMGRVVQVDAFTNYQCDKTTDTFLPQSCDKTVNVVVTQQAPVSAVVTKTLITSGRWTKTTGGSFGSRGTWTIRCNTDGVSYGGPNDYPPSVNYLCNSLGCYSSFDVTGAKLCPSIYNTVYSCPAGTTLTGSGTNSTCIYPAVVTSSVNNGCAVQEAAAL